LLALLAQATTGLFSNDDIGVYAGSLAKFVTKTSSDRATAIHAVTVKLLLAFVALHVLAIAAYAVVKGQNLLGPMLTGRKRALVGMQPPRMARSIAAAWAFAAAVTFAFFISQL
jgi:cytochrome b